MHTPEQEEIMTEYENAVDIDVQSFIQDVINGEMKSNNITIAFLTVNASRQIEILTKKHVEGNRVVLDTNAVKHILNRHGSHGEHDVSLKNIDDISRMGYVIMNYDTIESDNTVAMGYLDEKGEPSPTIKISKRIDGIYYVVEAVNSSKRRRCYVVTAYIHNEKQPSDP